ncbi:VPLPA-CTERM sorting domain-containing protein [Methylomonas albis]|uniref:VPLPA-CTERM sorting domain-containing protein n=1 Tax=Methylomonas albis TaxID=1854563 RepID=A0ABR9D350_9GAMM|nr:VPLPA-CTERM sorting domain-containing protein [Methylomonas albis]MBD9357537.1 VPLPA-CTERM sorting domain-containing protein [Methylomonas albis]
MRFKPSRLTLAIATTLAGGALSFNAAASTTMYNTFIAANDAATDGWVYGFCTSCTNSTRAINYVAGQAYTGGGQTGGGFYGTNESNPTQYTSATPFNYGGTSQLNWGAHLTSTGDSAEISQADAQARYGYAANIDTGGGAWRDTGGSTGGVTTGWKHQTDIGLIESDVTQNVTLNLTNLEVLTAGLGYSRFGITVFDGMDSQTAAYVHHGGWNNYGTYSPGGTTLHPYDMNNPFGTIGLTNIGYSDYVDSTVAHAFTFTAQAGHVYSIYLGGVDFSTWKAGVADYQLNITTSAVPVPGAVWLFGSALAGLGVTGRRKKTLS